MNKMALLLLSLCLTTVVNADPRCRTFNIEGNKERFEFLLPSAFTGLSVEGLDLSSDLSVQIDDANTYDLVEDLHMGSGTSHLIMPSEAFTKVVLLNAKRAELTGILKCYDAGYDAITLQKVEAVKAAYKKDGCDLPPVIDQDVWRKDLQDPDPGPATTEVRHLVIHHSATTNDVSDYLTAVRNIYLFHVNSNGWDDVGYNFLIDPNGVLYAGRDGQGADDDNIRGAHFCAKNSNTMGVCLIGNYSEIPPPDTMINTLARLLAWKTKKDGLQPLESTFHPRGSSSGFVLPTICGHRDGYKEGVYAGCNTECPGNYTYDLMDTVRRLVVTRLLDCDYIVSDDETSASSFSALASEGGVLLKAQEEGKLLIYDALGRSWLNDNMKALEPRQITLPKGVYLLYFEGKTGVQWQKVMVR